MSLAATLVASSLDFEARMGERSLVFDRFQEGSKFYRIPAIVTAPDGSLVAVADKRFDSNKDLPGRIDVVCRRSTDGGVTWGSTVTVAANNDEGGYGDPALVVDKNTGDILCIFTHGQGLWESDINDHATICLSRSGDNGLTWTSPREISQKFFGSYGSGCAVEGIGMFATSGRAFQAKNGRLMFVLVVRSQSKKWTPLTNYLVYSDDGGKTWEIETQPITCDGDEAKIVELPDGTLLCSIRSTHRGEPRKFSYQTERGGTWSETILKHDLPEPRCNGDIISIERDGKQYLLQTIPLNLRERTDVSILASDDLGETWENLITVCPTRSSYSSLTELPDGSLGIFTEEGCSDGGFRLWYSRIILAPKD